MVTCITENQPIQLGGDRSKVSSYPESERAYFKRVYGSDHLHQLRDGHQKDAISRYALPTRRAELKRILNQLEHLQCANSPEMTAPGRSAYSLSLLRENLAQYTRKQARSLRWNQHYRQALEYVGNDVKALLKGGVLKPMDFREVAASAPIQKNLDKNAGYIAFLTEQRSKGENLEEAVEWCTREFQNIIHRGHYGIPLVISHRSSNSKPVDDRHWKWKCRVILMDDIRALLLDGRFAIPFTDLFKNIGWGEGSMTHAEVREWVHQARSNYDRFYSSDYSKFDVSQPGWLIEDVFEFVVRPCFGELSEEDELAFTAMKNSYIHKDIHTFDGVIHSDACQISGALTTYAFNTIINQIVDCTVLLMQGCNLKNFHSLKCGDDNLTYYRRTEPWSREKHASLIRRYFGIETTLTENDCGGREDDPLFLSRYWTPGGETRDIREVLWNLRYPERYRDYRTEKTHVPVERAEALVMCCACLEQDKTMREYFDVQRIFIDANVPYMSEERTYQAVARLKSGFLTPKLIFRIGTLKQNPVL